MKTRLIIVLAAVAMLFTACKKDNVPAKNQLIYNGEKHELISWGGLINIDGSQYYFSGQTETTEEEPHPEFGFWCYIYENSINATYDLTQGPISGDAGYHISFEINPDQHLYFSLDNRHGTIYSELYDWENNYNFQEDASCFKSGTMTVNVDEEGLSCVLSGVLKNDDTIDINIYIPKEDLSK